MMLLKAIIIFITLFVNLLNSINELYNLLFGIISLLILLTLFFSVKVYISILKQNTIHNNNINLLNKQYENFDFKNQNHQFSEKDFSINTQILTEKIQRLKSHILGVNLWVNSHLSK